MTITWETTGPAPTHVAPGANGCTRDGAQIVAEALEQCGEADEFLDAAAAEGETVVLVVNDGHRSTRTRDALGALAAMIGRCRRVPRFRALIATGTHRFGEPERHDFERETFGDCGLWIADCGMVACTADPTGPLPDRGLYGRAEIEGIAWHDAEPSANGLIDVGGVDMHPWLAGGRFLLPIGSVEPHYFAGFTGAHKTVTIGCMSRESIERNHIHALSPASDIARLEGNPVYDDIARTLHALESAGKRILAINEVVRDGQVIAAAAGGPLESLNTLLPTVHRVYLHQVPQPMDLLHLKVPLPLGRNLYQADKALKNNHLAVRDGGGILLEADCFEGVGPDAFLNLLRRADTYSVAMRHVSDEGYKLGDHKAVKLRYLTDPSRRGVHVALVSSHIDKVRTGATTAGIKAFEDVESAIVWLNRAVREPLRRGLVVEDAGCVAVKAPGG